MTRAGGAAGGAAPPRFVWTLLLLGLGPGLAGAGARPLAAQQEPPPAPDSVQSAEEAADSTEERIRERLRRLARPVGYDSVLFVEDSVRLAGARQGVRPTMAASGDSVLAALAGIPGYTLTRYEGAEAEFRAGDRVLTLRAPEEGQARVAREGIEVQADSAIVFDETSGRMRTSGMATFTPPEGEPVSAPGMVYDLNQGRGSARQARTEFAEGGTRWFMTGDMPYAAQDSTFLSHARFTTCDLEEPHYHFETDEIKVVGGRLLVARGVKLYFADVPVAWLPFMAQSLESGRASGLLTPRFSVNDIVSTSSGYRRRISNLGFYWAMSDYTDATLAADWFSGAFFSLQTDFRYRVLRQFLEGRASVRRFWREDGSGEFSVNTDHSWQPDERTSIQANATFTTDVGMVVDYSLDPRETTRDITSTAGVDRRFDWGTLSVSANRSQYLSDNRVEWTLPSASLSLTSRTLFPAPIADARFYNNLTWSARTSVSRRLMDREEPPTFAFATADTENRSATVGTRLGIGNLSVSPSVSFREQATHGVPLALLDAPPDVVPDSTALSPSAPARDIADAEVSVTTNVDYQQRLIGSTTLTPHLTVSRSYLRADTSVLASSFVGGPTRLTLGATLKTDIYGFFGGFGPFEAVRHKVTPSIDYDWTPEATPSELQQAVFGPSRLRAQNVVRLTLNQTFEAKRRAGEGGGGAARADTAAIEAEPGEPPDSLGLQELQQAGVTGAPAPRRVQSTPVVKLLGLTTSVIAYDFVEADSLGMFLAGFQSPVLTNTISSDYLRGLSVTVQHDLFQDSVAGGVLVERSFAPRLSGLRFGFSLGSSSGIVRWLGLGRDDGRAAPTGEEVPEDEVDPFEDDPLLGEQSMIPEDVQQDAGTTRRPRNEVGVWNARLDYALQRPRGRPAGLSQMLSASLSLRPTENWDVSWRTSYDLEAGAFNDHIVRLTRDLHDWEARFDFVQTATGNWSFRFEVALSGLRDLKFDYRQRNLEVQESSSP